MAALPVGMFNPNPDGLEWPAAIPYHSTLIIKGTGQGTRISGRGQIWKDYRGDPGPGNGGISRAGLPSTGFDLHAQALRRWFGPRRSVIHGSRGRPSA